MKKTLLWTTAMAAACLMLAACGATPARPVSDALPNEPDYSDSTQWYMNDRGGQADLFYIISTETGDYTRSEGALCHYADTYNDSVRGPLRGEMTGVDHLLSGNLNYYSPYYRQCSLQSYASDSLTQARMPLPTGDVRRAFNYYLEHLNQGRPFILAGYSQGAIILLELLKEIDDSAINRMIAAYVIGATVSDDDARHPHIMAARRADDTGVTICYNSVRDAGCALPHFEYSAMAINPVNWRTDDTPATLTTEPSPHIPADRQQKDRLTVRLDPTTRLLFVDGYTGTDYVLPLIGKEGCYHSREVWLYREQLRLNMALRADSFLKQRERGRQ
ncbi:MAG: DUF3089 domain-containing protein [Bacteroidaceae bacterium]|nr:DUF3089 domain-containing protein [Bacteroidaceae bacterium]MBQ2029612.1 DUF3089 domain-containing protein [Bacteroidaceae bacterium]